MRQVYALSKIIDRQKAIELWCNNNIYAQIHGVKLKPLDEILADSGHDSQPMLNEKDEEFLNNYADEMTKRKAGERLNG